jgi:hypothetical protein
MAVVRCCWCMPPLSTRTGTLPALACALALVNAPLCTYKHPPADRGFCVGLSACWHVAVHVFLVAHGLTLCGGTA